MLKLIYRNFFRGSVKIIILCLLFTQLNLVVNAQLDVTHYIPPAWASDGKDADYRDHVIVLSTGEITPFNVTLSNGDGTLDNNSIYK